MPRGVVARWNTRDVAFHLHFALSLRREVAHDRSQLQHRELHLCEPALERAHLQHQSPALLIELMNVFGHLLQLLDARLVVAPVDVHSFDQLLEMLDHGVETSTKRAAAGRTRAILAERDDAIALVLDLGVLLSQRFALGLRFLSVAHPFGSPRFKEALSILELGALLFQLQRCFFFERRRLLDSRVTLLESRDLLAQRGLGFKQRLPPAFLAIEYVERLELDVEREQWLDRIAQGGELSARGLNAFQLARNALGVPLECCFFFLRDRDLGQQLRGLLPLALHHFPAWLDCHHLALAHCSAMRRVVRARFGFFLS